CACGASRPTSRRCGCVSTPSSICRAEARSVASTTAASFSAATVVALPWTTIEAVSTPEGTLALQRRAERDWLITIDGRVLMNSVAHGSEVALGTLACRGLAGRPQPRVLVGGLGMGFTL